MNLSSYCLVSSFIWVLWNKFFDTLSNMMKRNCLLYFLNINTDFFIVIIHKLFVAFFINYVSKYETWFLLLEFFFLLTSFFLSFFSYFVLSFLHLSFCFFKRELNLRVFEWMRRWSSWKISFFKNEITADIQILVVVNSSFSFRWALLRSFK